MDFIDSLKETEEKDYPVLAEIPINNTQLHRIATGKPCVIAQPGETLAIRFLLKSSFKSRASNYVVNNFIAQVVAVGKDNPMRREEMGVKTQIKTVTKEKIVRRDKNPQKIESIIKNQGEELW